MERVLDALTGPDPVRILGVVAGALMLWWLFALVGHRSLRRLARGEGPEAAERLKRVETVWVALRRLAALVIFVLALLTVMAIAGISLTPLLAVGSAVALAVGFGAQNFVKDVIAGFFIIVEGQYRIGDVVRIADIAGKVEEIRLRVTVLRDLDANVHYIPNGEISVASNFTQQFAQVVADVGVAYRSDLDRALEVLGDEALSFSRDEAWSYSFLQEPEVLGVQELADSAVVLRVTLKVLPEARWPVRREFFRRIKNRFDAEGIEIPFPHRTLFLGDPEGWREAIGGRT
jgi:small-conductance mechanosensitive channel